MGLLFSGPQGFEVDQTGMQFAGGLPGTSGADYTSFGAQLNQMPPGYTGGVGSNNVINTKGVSPDFRYMIDYMNLKDAQAYEREQANFYRGLAARKAEAQEAYKMQLPFKIAGAVTDVFKNIQLARQPYVQAEMNIRSNTAPLLSNVYGNNPYANRKWIA